MNDSPTQTADGHFPTFRRLFGWLFGWRMIRRCLFVLVCLATLLALYYAEQNFAATAFVQSWFEKRNPGEPWHAKDNYSRASTTVKALKYRAEYVDLVAWETAFAAVRSGKPDSNKKLASNKFDLESRAKAAPAVLEGLKDERSEE